LFGADRKWRFEAVRTAFDPERTWATSKDISASARLPATYGELTHVHRYTLVHAIFRCRSSLYPRRLPSIAAAEHALFECSGIGKSSNVTGLTIAKIERGLGDRGTAWVPVRSNDVSVNLIYNLIGTRSSGACEHNE
jgi:hypothetical protein